MISGDPCPFLRALARIDAISEDVDPLPHLSEVAASAFPATAPRFSVRAIIYLIALVGNGLQPTTMWRNATEGLRANRLRGGPLDKRGSGSRILDGSGNVVPTELDRIDTFAIDYRNPESARLERGLGSAELTAMMNANYERAGGRRRRVDRALMNGEWPILLRVMGMPSEAGPYLRVSELRRLFLDRTLPERVHERIARISGTARPTAADR